MKIIDFKRRFNKLKIEDKIKALSEMEKATPETYLKSVEPVKHEETKKAFEELLEWCQMNILIGDITNELR